MDKMCYIKNMRRHAFTLLELLIVLLILGVLTGIAVPRYMESTKNAKRTTFETNLQDILKALEDYKIKNQFTNTLYPSSLSQLMDNNTFNKEPINPYTGKSMLSSNSEESGLQYQATGGKYKLCVVQRDVEDVNNNGDVNEPLPLVTKTTCVGDTVSNMGVVFARNSVAYTSNGAQVGVNVPRFEQGKFGQAIMVEEGTTNIFPHSKSFEECSGTHIGDGDPSNSNGVATYVGGGWRLATQYNSATIKISEDGGLFGSKRLSFIHDGSSGWKGAISSDWSIVAGRTYTVTVWARANQASTKSFSTGYAFYKEGGQQYLFNWPDGYPTDAKNAGKWVRGIRTFTAAANESGRVYLYGLTDGEAGLIIDYDGLQVEENPYVTSFIDGTRSAETLTIPTAGVLNPQEGTVEFTVIPSYNWNANLGRLAGYFGCKGSAFNKSRILIYKDGNYLRCLFQNTDTTVAANIAKDISGFSNKDPLYLAATWKSGRIAFLVNGVLVGEVAATWNVTEAFTSCYVGSGESGMVQANALIDDLRISSRARTDAEIQAAYRNNQSLPVDAWTTLKLDFNGDLSTQSGVIP